jgi:hypothetical protein
VFDGIHIPPAAPGRRFHRGRTERTRPAPRTLRLLPLGVRRCLRLACLPVEFVRQACSGEIAVEIKLSSPTLFEWGKKGTRGGLIWRVSSTNIDVPLSAGNRKNRREIDSGTSESADYGTWTCV